MQITIEYESKYSLSTVKNGENILTGMAVITADSKKNVSGIFKSENNFLQNIKELNKYYPNYQYAEITIDTVIGILCRLVGEVRRLDILDDNHLILSLKDKISFKNDNSDFQNEVIMLHSELKEVQNNAGGIISKDKENHFLLSRNDLSETLLSVFNYKNQNDIVNLLTAFKNNDPSYFYTKYNDNIKANTFVKEHLSSEEFQKDIFKGISFLDGDNLLKEFAGRLFYGNKDDVLELENFYLQNYQNEKFKSSDISDYRKNLVNPVSEIYNIYGFLFAKKIEFLRRNELFETEFSNSLNKDKTSIKGLAPGSGGLTIKDFYTNFMNEKKMSWTMPYSVSLKKDLFDSQDEKWFNAGASIGVTKESGKLIIDIDISKEEAYLLYQKIEEASVNTFHLGKKGLAYVKSIDLE